MPSLSEQTGRTYWRNLDELANTPEFQAFISKEFPHYAPSLMTTPTRRQFLKVMGASVALAGLVGCRRYPERKLAPFASRPEGRVPGEPQYYATCYDLMGVAVPVLATAYDGRPTKIEGNPDHPASGGAADQFVQASILDLYDPHRLRRVLQGRGEAQQPVDWPRFESALQSQLAAAKQNDGAGLTVLVQPSSSPTLDRLRDQLKQAHPQASWVTYEPLGFEAKDVGTRAQYDLTDAKVIVSFGSDFMAAHPDRLRLMRQWANGRTVDEDHGHFEISRLYVAESVFTVTGANADERMPLDPASVQRLAERVAQRVADGDAAGSNHGDALERSAAQIASDLLAHRGEAVVVTDPTQPRAIQDAAAAINRAIGAIGNTVTYLDADTASNATDGVVPEGTETLVILGGNPMYDGSAELIASVENAATRIHLTDSPNETTRVCDWAVPRTHYLEAWGDGRSWDGTVCLAQPLIMPLWETRTTAGTYRTRVLSDIEMTALLLGEKPDGMALVQQTASEHLPGDAGGMAWKKGLHHGFIADTAFDTVDAPSPRGDRSATPAEPTDDRPVIHIRRDSKLLDGRFANNGWLQEMPDPMIQVTWGNVAAVSYGDAERNGWQQGDVLKLTAGGRTVEAPVYIVPGQADGVIGLTLGYGRDMTGPVGTGVGVDVYPLIRAADGASVVQLDSKPEKVGHQQVASTQDHFTIDAIGQEIRGRRVKEAIQAVPVGWYEKKPNRFQGYWDKKVFGKAGEKGDHKVIPLPQAGEDHNGHDEHDDHDAHGTNAPTIPAKDELAEDGLSTSRQPQQWPAPLDAEAKEPTNAYQWGMVIDLNKCTGCGACIVACQAENNVPIVGHDQVIMNREMHWLRVDRFFTGDPEHPESIRAAAQPMMCVHCENAPCEQVCPVAATVHDSEGLNVMVYNRCIGTRYCSNNCPYKVRRFNYFDWHSRDPRIEGDTTPPYLGIPDQQQLDQVDKIRRMQFHPDVTVRMRGVMEKCTYCIQRLKHYQHKEKVAAAQEDRQVDGRIPEGELQTACQQTCATEAISFGNLKDPNATVSQKFYGDKRGYFVLEELNVRPRTKYLAKLTNPVDPPADTDGGGGH